MARRDINDLSLTIHAAYEEDPLAEILADNETAVMSYMTNKKSLALNMIHDRKLYLKCDMLGANFLRHAYICVVSGWHMNKGHWYKVVIGTDVPEEEFMRQIGNSYEKHYTHTTQAQYDAHTRRRCIYG